MKLETAIEIQTIHNEHNPDITDAERREAHQLGIEALKRIQYLRFHGYQSTQIKLLGETED